MDGTRFDSLVRRLHQTGSRRRALAALGGGVLAALGRRPARAQDVDWAATFAGRPPTRAPQATCATTTEDPGACIQGFCSFTCPEGIFGTAVCVQPVNRRGEPHGGSVCVGNAFCEPTPNCGPGFGGCGPGEVCVRTCCGGGSQCPPPSFPGCGVYKCAPRCTANND